MTDIEKIYSSLENSGIIVANMRFNKIEAVSLCDNEYNRSIVVDESKFETPEQLKTALLHEQGHCETYSFYDFLTPFDVRSKLERRADKYVAENKITSEMIDNAHEKEGFVDVWEFAEYFGVTDDYMKRLMNIHFDMNFMD